jgi:repressor LexA
MEAFGFRSVQSAREHLEALVKEGRLVKDKGKARGYRLPDDSGSHGTLQLVPLLGRVAAGALDIAAEDHEGYIPIRSRYPTDELFALRVRGESMTGAGIYPDDIVVVRQQPTAETGEIVVALVGDEATVKRLRIHRKRVELHPENPDFDVIVPDVTQFSLLGKVIELHRYLERS